MESPARSRRRALGRRAAPLPAGDPRRRGELDGRLKPSRELDVVLTDFGLSPQPSVLLVVEGATEVVMLKRLFAHYAIRENECLISVEDREGIGKDLAALVSYAVAPRTRIDVDARYLQLRRPATRLLVVNDAEGPMRTASQREGHRVALIDRVMRRLETAHRTTPVRDAIDGHIHLETWAGDGESFEFAHFTDRQLAVAMSKCDDRARQPDLPRRIELVARCRAVEGNLADVMKGASKLALAEALWPVLERKLLRAKAHGTEEHIPLVRVLYTALDLASRSPRRNYVMTL